MALVAVGPGVLLRELRRRVIGVFVDHGVAEREGVALVVVVGAVLGVGVVELNAETVGETLVHGQGEAPVAAPGGRLDRPEGCDAVGSVGSEAGGPGGAQLRGVPVDEPRQVIRGGVVVSELDSQIRQEFPRGSDGELRGPRVLEIRVESVDARVVRNAAGFGRRKDVRVRGRKRSAEVAERAVAVDALADRAVGRTRRGDVEAGDARVVDPEVGAHDGLAVAFVGSQETPTRGCNIFVSEGIVPSEGKRLPVRRLADEAGEEHLGGRRDRSGLSCASQRRPYWMVRLGFGCHLSCTKSATLLGDVLGARLLDRQAADAGLLEVEEHRAGDVGARRAGARLRGCAVRSTPRSSGCARSSGIRSSS